MAIWIDHFAIALRSIAEGEDFFSRYLPLDPISENLPGHTDDFRWRQYRLGHVTVEFLESARQGSFIDQFLEKRGEGLHHLTLHTNDLAPFEASLEADGRRLVDRWEEPDGDERCVFISPRSAYGMLIQLWQVDEEPPAPVAQADRITPMPGVNANIVFDHLAVAAEDLAETKAFFARHFPLEKEAPAHRGYAGDFDITQFEIAGRRLEIIADASGSSFVRTFLDKRGPGFHHLSIDVDDIDVVLERLRADGIRIVDEAEIGDGWKTAFISPRSAHGVLIQFWQVPDLTNTTYSSS